MQAYFSSRPVIIMKNVKHLLVELNCKKSWKYHEYCMEKILNLFIIGNKPITRGGTHLNGVYGPIVYYILGVGRRRVQKNVMYQNFTPLPQIITYENCRPPPLGNNNIENVPPTPTPTPSRPSFFFHIWNYFILGHWFHTSSQQHSMRFWRCMLGKKS